MPANSKSQKRLASMAKGVKAGELPASKFPAAAQMAKSMKPSDLNEFASTPMQGLPERKAPRVRNVGGGIQRIPIPKKR